MTANGGAYAPLSDLATQFGKGSGLYADALGINGAEGNSRAVDAYHAAPGYQNTLNTGIDSLARLANASGQGFGGNTNRDAIKFAENTANGDYNNWLSNLSGYNNLQLGATSGAATGNAGVNSNVANILNTGGQNKAQIATGQGANLSDLAKSYYGGLAGLDTSQGGALASNATGATNTINSADLNLAPQIGKTYNDAAAAQTAGSGNLWNFGLNVAKLAAGGAGGAAGGGGGSSFLPSSSFLSNGMSWG